MTLSFLVQDRASIDFLWCDSTGSIDSNVGTTFICDNMMLQVGPNQDMNMSWFTELTFNWSSIRGNAEIVVAPDLGLAKRKPFWGPGYQSPTSKVRLLSSGFRTWSAQQAIADMGMQHEMKRASSSPACSSSSISNAEVVEQICLSCGQVSVTEPACASVQMCIIAPYQPALLQKRHLKSDEW